MTTPLFNILARNLGKADVDRCDAVFMVGRLNRKGPKTSQQVIDAWLVANELVNSGMTKTTAAREVSVRHQVGFSNLINGWRRIEAAAKAQK